MEDFYTDEPIGWNPSDDQDESLETPEGTDNIHSWDYFAPDEDADDPLSWQQKSFQASYNRVEAASAPEKIRQLVEMIRRQPWQITRAKSFYEQAMFMADYDDNAEIVEYMNYFPTYRDMTVQQMRSYFTIRKMWRQGKFPDVSLSYIFVYVYEMLMQVGIDKPEDGLEILQELLAAYSPSIPKLERYLNPWMRDYVVYYNLQDKFKEFFAEENMQDALADLIKDYDKIDGKSLLDAVCSMSKYDIRNSQLFKRQHDKALSCTIAVLRAIIPKIESQTHHHIETFCFGKKVKRQVTMFSNAVFYDPKPVRSAEIFVAPRHRYVCRGGMWSKDEYVSNPLHVGKVFGAILHETDRQLRAALGVKPKLNPRPLARLFGQDIQNAISAWTEEERKAEAAREAERRRVSIDFSKLGKIRSDAEVVMEKLEASPQPLSKGEGQDMSLGNIEPKTEIEKKTEIDKNIERGRTAVHPKTSKGQISPSPLERGRGEASSGAFLRLFLSGGDWRQYLRDIHVPEGVMVEKINNKAMDEIGDIVLEDDGSGLHLIEDYRDDVKELFNIE